MEVGWGWGVVGRRNELRTDIALSSGQGTRKSSLAQTKPCPLLPTQIHVRSRDPFLLNLLFLRFIFLPKLFKIDVK